MNITTMFVPSNFQSITMEVKPIEKKLSNDLLILFAVWMTVWFHNPITFSVIIKLSYEISSEKPAGIRFVLSNRIQAMEFLIFLFPI